MRNGEGDQLVLRSGYYHHLVKRVRVRVGVGNVGVVKEGHHHGIPITARWARGALGGIYEEQ